MKINKIYVGSWYPRTVFHFNELYEFLKDGTSHLALDKNKIKSLRDSINPTDISLDDFLGRRMLNARFDKYHFENHESGLMLLSCDCVDVVDFKKEMISLSGFAFKKVFPSFSYLYSLGAPIPKVFSAMKSVMPYVFFVEDASREEIFSFFEENGFNVLKEVKNNKIEVFYSKSFVVIKGDQKTAENLIREGLYYINDAENQFQRILDLHRFVWSEVSDIKSSQKIKYKNLPETRDLIMEINSEVVFFKSRIEQLDNILKIQSSRVKNLFDEENDPVWGYVSDRFNSLTDSGEYIKSLWTMTDDYLKGSLDLVSLVYQESSAKQINILQFIFIISAVASIIALGSIYGFDYYALGPSGEQILTNKAISFSVTDLIKLGVPAVVVGVLFYGLFNLVYRHFSSSRISNPNLIANKEFEKIKKMLN